MAPPPGAGNNQQQATEDGGHWAENYAQIRGSYFNLCFCSLLFEGANKSLVGILPKFSRIPVSRPLFGLFSDFWFQSEGLFPPFFCGLELCSQLKFSIFFTEKYSHPLTWLGGPDPMPTLSIPPPVLSGPCCWEGSEWGSGRGAATWHPCVPQQWWWQQQQNHRWQRGMGGGKHCHRWDEELDCNDDDDTEDDGNREGVK